METLINGLRDVLRGLPADFREIEEVFKKLSSRVPDSKLLKALTESTGYLALQLNEEVLVDLRISVAVVELFVSGRFLDSLVDLGFTELYNILAGNASSIKSVAISKAIPSNTLYLIIQGDGTIIPNIRLMISKELYDLSSSFCRISPTENTYTFLTSILDLGKKYFNEFFRLT